MLDKYDKLWCCWRWLKHFFAINVYLRAYGIKERTLLYYHHISVNIKCYWPFHEQVCTQNTIAIYIDNLLGLCVHHVAILFISIRKLVGHEVGDCDLGNSGSTESISHLSSIHLRNICIQVAATIWNRRNRNWVTLCLWISCICGGNFKQVNQICLFLRKSWF